MLADNMRMDTARVDFFVLPDQIPETSAVEQCAGADDSVRREAALFQSYIR
ncbi:hypothetical protein D3C81_2335090 [compost metagenome]